MPHASSSGFPDGAPKRKKRSSLDSEVSSVSSDRSLPKKHKNESSILLQGSRDFDKVKAQPRRATRSSIASNSSLGASVRDDVFYDNESGQTNQGVSKKGELFEKISVPQDGNSLFWSIALAYLIPVKNDNELFKERYEKLFGNENSNELKDVRNCIKGTPPYDCVYDNKTLKRLVTETFRGRVVDRNEVDAGRTKITIYDIYRNTDSINKFVAKFTKNYSFFIQKHKIDVKKLTDGNTVKDELDKVNKNATKNLKKLIRDIYLEHMKQAGFYAGEPEIVAIKEILGSSLYVLSQDSKERRYTGYGDQMNLFLNREKCYSFGLIKVEELTTLIEATKGRHDLKRIVKLLLDKGVRAVVENHYNQTVEELVKSSSNKDVMLDLLGQYKHDTAARTRHAKGAKRRRAARSKGETLEQSSMNSGVNTTPYTDTSPDTLPRAKRGKKLGLSMDADNIICDSFNNNSSLTYSSNLKSALFTSTPNDPISLQFFAHDQGLSNEKPSGSKVRQSGRMGSDTNAPRMVDEQCQTEKQKLLVNVPGDGSCLFWSVALAYLIPVKNNNKLFKERCEKLFGNVDSNELQCVQDFINGISPGDKLNLKNIDKENPTLKKLVTETFRKRVADTIYDEQGKLDYTKRTVTIHDIFESMNGEYITDFVKNFRNRFQDEILKCGIDIEKLKTLVEVEAELNKINNFPEDKLHELSDFVLESYKECLSNQGSWAGEYEMKAIEDLLTCGIWVREGEYAPKHIREPEFSSDLGLRGGQSNDSIQLVRIDKSHYKFELDEETLKQTGGIFKDSEISASASNSQESSVAGKPRRRTGHAVNYSIDNSGDDYDSSGSEYTPSIKRSNSDSQSPLEDVTHTIPSIKINFPSDKHDDSTRDVGKVADKSERLSVLDKKLLAVSSNYDSESTCSSISSCGSVSDVSTNDEVQSREMSSAENEEVERWYKFLRRKIGLDITARQLIETNPELAKINKSELMIRLAYELCLAKNTEYDPKNDAAKNEKENNKHRRFDTSRVFALFKVLSEVVEKSDRRNFVEFVCQKGNVQLLEMICRQESKSRVGKIRIEQQYSWKGEFTGYERLTDLLQYVLEKRCSSEIVLSIAKKVYGTAHILCNGEQYLDDIQVAKIKRNFSYQDPVIKDCLKAAIELGYKDVVPIMLGGDIYRCIRLMKNERFQGEERFSEAFKMIEETVAEVMSPWVCKQDLSKEVKGLLKEGIEVDINKMGKKDLIDELESRRMKVKHKSNTTQKELVKMLEKGEGGKVKLKLGKIVVGSLISMLFFNHQDKLMKKSFELRITHEEKSKREKEINELNDKIDSKSFVKEKVLEKIKLLNSSSHGFNSWFFREVLAAIVNDEERFDKLKAVCAAICEKPMQELLKSAEVNKNVIDALGFFGVEISSSQITTSEIPKSSASIGDHFAEDIRKLAGKIKEEGKAEVDKETSKPKESDRLAFSGLSRNIIIELKKKKRLKKDFTDDEKDNLSNAVSRAMSEIKEGINILAGSTDVGDIFEHFEVINSEIEKEDKREIVELACQKGNVQLLEMICQQENRDGGGRVQINRQYSWKGEFTGYERLIDLLQHVLEQRCSFEIVLCIAKKVYGNAHIIYSGEQYLGNMQVASMKKNFNYQYSVIKDCLKAAIELGYKDVVPIMLSGDIYHCIRVMQGEKFQEEKEALKMIEETVAEVMSSWVCKQDLSKEVRGLLKEGIEVDINKMGKKDLIDELESRGIELSRDDKRGKIEKLREKLKVEEVKLKLRKTVVGSLISTLFFNHQDKLMEKSFELRIAPHDGYRREKEINELNDKIDSKSFVKEKVLEKIKLLNSSSHEFNSWFFKEVLSAIMNDEGKLNKLQAVCAAICKEPMEKLLKGVEVHEDVVGVLKLFGVDSLELGKSMVVVPENSDNALAKDFIRATNSEDYKYELSTSDIRDIAEAYYGWKASIDRQGLKDTSQGIFFDCFDQKDLKSQLQKYQDELRKGNNLVFTSIINLDGNHWVTLVIACKDERFIAYYCDSFGKELPSEISSALEKTLRISISHIGRSEYEQQKDKHNCGIFALINAEKITDAVRNSSSTKIDVQQLTLSNKELEKMRVKFAKKVKEIRMSREIVQDMGGVESKRALSGQQPSADIEAISDNYLLPVYDNIQSTSTPTLANQGRRGSKSSPQQSHIAKYMRPSAPLGNTHFTSSLTAPKAAEKNNKGFMQNNCRQGENGGYNEDNGSHCQDEAVGLIIGDLGMKKQGSRRKRLNQRDLAVAVREASERARASSSVGIGEEVGAIPPSFERCLVLIKRHTKRK